MFGSSRMSSLSIIFEDVDVLVVNKPAGVATQAPRQFDSFEARIREYLQGTAEPSSTPYLGIPHRLDRCASGVMVFAKRRKAAQRLSKQFEDRSVQKTYIARVTGRVDPASGHWHDFLRKIPDQPKGEVVDETHADARLATLRYETILVGDKFSELQIQLETGRMHQIRIQCATRGYPVLGDVLYGSEQAFGPTVEDHRERQIALHANRIGFEHPRSRERVVFDSQRPETWS